MERDGGDDIFSVSKRISRNLEIIRFSLEIIQTDIQTYRDIFHDGFTIEETLNQLSTISGQCSTIQETTLQYKEQYWIREDVGVSNDNYREAEGRMEDEDIVGNENFEYLPPNELLEYGKPQQAQAELKPVLKIHYYSQNPNEKESNNPFLEEVSFDKLISPEGKGFGVHRFEKLASTTLTRSSSGCASSSSQQSIMESFIQNYLHLLHYLHGNHSNALNVYDNINKIYEHYKHKKEIIGEELVQDKVTIKFSPLAYYTAEPKEAFHHKHFRNNIPSPCAYHTSYLPPEYYSSDLFGGMRKGRIRMIKADDGEGDERTCTNYQLYDWRAMDLWQFGIFLINKLVIDGHGTLGSNGWSTMNSWFQLFVKCPSIQEGSSKKRKIETTTETPNIALEHIQKRDCDDRAHILDKAFKNKLNHHLRDEYKDKKHDQWIENISDLIKQLLWFDWREKNSVETICKNLKYYR